MASDVTTGLFTLAGAVIGGGGTFVVSWLTARNQRLLALVARDHHLLDRQYAEHRDHLLRVDRLIEAARMFVDAVTSDQARDALANRHSEYVDLWTKYAEGRGGPELAGPLELLEPLSALHQAVDAYSSALDEWWYLMADAEQATLDYYTRSADLLSVAKDKRREYQLAALKALGQPHRAG